MKKIILIMSCFFLTAIANATITLVIDSVYIQGYYIGSGLMTPANYNGGCTGWVNTKTCGLTVELHYSTPPFSVAANGVATGAVLPTDGHAYGCTFSITPSSSTSYYAVVRSLNGIDTWSANTIVFPTSSPVSYDFASDSSYAYNGCQANVSGGGYTVYAIYSGDIVNDGYINGADSTELDIEINSFNSGCLQHGDLNGDGNVDLLDWPVLAANLTYPTYIQVCKP